MNFTSSTNKTHLNESALNKPFSDFKKPQKVKVTNKMKKEPCLNEK